MLPTWVIPAITNDFYQYQTFRLVFIGDTSFSFRYASSAMTYVRYNLHSDLTLSQTSSDDKILPTVWRTLGNTLFKALDTWSVRWEIIPNAFVSLRFNACVYEQFFRIVLKGNFVIIWATVFMYDDDSSFEIAFFLHIYQVHMTQQTSSLLLCLCQEISRIWNTFYH